MEEMLNDERFAHIPRDPAFKRIPKKERKVIIDKRFQSMFNDKKFKVKYTVDKRGRPVQNSSSENLKRYYALESSEESDESSEADVSVDSQEKNTKKIKNKSIVNTSLIKKVGKYEADLGIKERSVEKSKSNEGSINFPIKGSQTQVRRNDVHLNRSDEEGEEEEEEEEEEEDEDEEAEEHAFQEGIGSDKLDSRVQSTEEKIRTRLQDMSVDYARGEGVILSDSSSDEESSDEDEEDDKDVDHGWGELDQDAARTNDSTNRLAVCNMDWDRIQASDLMVLFNSFLPKGGVIHSITVYPSEYGLQRMKIEETKGPLELRGDGEARVVDSSEQDEEEKRKKRKWLGKDEELEGDAYHREKLRQYQLNRLRYYYAVVVCDSVETADVLYKQCDGMEYESSAARLDLRFIPDDTAFDQEPRETCTELPNLKKYEPQFFVTTALQQVSVELTWDETDPKRTKFVEKLKAGEVGDVDDNDLKVYLASSSSEEEEDEEEGEAEKKEKLASKYRALLDSTEPEEKEKEKDREMEMKVVWGVDLQETVKRRLKEGKTEELTPFQVYLQKRKEKHRAKVLEQKKRKEQLKQYADAPQESNGSGSEDDVPADVDMNDAYFKEEFEKEEFLHTEKKESTKKKKKKDKKKKLEESDDEESKKKKAELELLLMDADDNRKHFNLNDILVEDTKNKKKKKKQKRASEEAPVMKEDDFQINVQDDRFSALYTSHLYNIDPADPHYKKTKGMEALRQEKLNRRQLDEEVPIKKHKLDDPGRKQHAELSQLIKNVKRKTQSLKK